MKIHFIGIGGIGVSALAQYYLAKGHKISGSDLASSEIIEFLKKKGVKIFVGKHKAKDLSRDTDLVIYSPAVKSNNPELKKAKKLQATNYKLKILSYPEALGELTKQYFTIAVSGTHGKSTTTAMISLILINAGLDPTVIIGTKVKEFGDNNFRMGGFAKFEILNLKFEILIIEACEHFASFLNYWPKIIVLTNIEKEHLDYYKNLNNVLKAYKKYIGHLPKNGTLVANQDDKNIQKIICNQFSIFNCDPTGSRQGRQQFSQLKDVKKLKKILQVPGEHNVANALAALTAARALKISDKISFQALSEYKGAWRRFEVSRAELCGTKRRITRKITIISDYAHHPTEIRATLKTAYEKYFFPVKSLKKRITSPQFNKTQKEIWCIFQPHQYQRTFYLFKDFVEVFKEALEKTYIQKLIITDIFDVAGREQKGLKRKMNAKKLVKAINNPATIYLPKKNILNFLKKNLKGKEIVIFMGAGDIYKFTPRTLRSSFLR
ncbi:UDP-N-acetylmuramate--L-alanine ligase [Patescibacteria group bacterium]|nr:UDP-N-acetylmuramate--L-alanine ligase [Patescibacteria group bacterium]